MNEPITRHPLLESDRPSISIVIVAWNSARYLAEVLDAALAQHYRDYEIIIVDNASSDETLSIARSYETKGVKVIAQSRNRGFAGGNNDGVAAARGDLIVLLNPDAVMTDPGTLQKIAVAFSSQHKLGVLGAKLMQPDGVTIDHCGGNVGIPAHTRLIGQGEPDEGQCDHVRAVDFVIGALFAVPRPLWDELSGFDEYFNPAYYEDTDFCCRIRQAGYQVLVWPEVCLKHYGRASSHEYKSRSFYWMHHKNRLWYTAKNLPMPSLIFQAIPAEIAWYLSPNARFLRTMMLRIYWITLKRFLVRRILGIKPLQ